MCKTSDTSSNNSTHHSIDDGVRIISDYANTRLRKPSCYAKGYGSGRAVVMIESGVIQNNYVFTHETQDLDDILNNIATKGRNAYTSIDKLLEALDALCRDNYDA